MIRYVTVAVVKGVFVFELVVDFLFEPQVIVLLLLRAQSLHCLIFAIIVLMLILLHF